LTAILGGLGATLAYTGTSLLIAHTTTFVPAVTIAALAMTIGLVIVAPFAIAEGIPDGLDATSATWLVIGGMTNVLGFLCCYSALGVGQVGAVAPIVSTEGAFAAIFAFIGGEQISTPIALCLAVIAGGVVVVARATPADASLTTGQGSRPAVVPSSAGTAMRLALGGALLFGLSLYAIGRASEDLPVAWVVLASRVFGTLLVTAPLWARGQLRMTRPAWLYVTAIAALEALGLAFYAIGARDSLAVTAVLVSQFAAFATVAAAILFHERLRRSQIAGLVTIGLGVAVLSALYA
jgi:drug/metabolite transporter (DMT)-like permease